MYCTLSGSWAHRVETTDFIKPSESSMDLQNQKPAFEYSLNYSQPTSTPVYPDLPSCPPAYNYHPIPPQTLSLE